MCVPQASQLRARLETVLRKVGINIANTGLVVTVTLPPRPAATSSGPTNQNTP
jgi:H+/gluconate symporter-like permease